VDGWLINPKGLSKLLSSHHVSVPETYRCELRSQSSQAAINPLSERGNRPNQLPVPCESILIEINSVHGTSRPMARTSQINNRLINDRKNPFSASRISQFSPCFTNESAQHLQDGAAWPRCIIPCQPRKNEDRRHREVSCSSKPRNALRSLSASLSWWDTPM
jgi:hypothetical protein